MLLTSLIYCKPSHCCTRSPGKFNVLLHLHNPANISKCRCLKEFLQSKCKICRPRSLMMRVPTSSGAVLPHLCSTNFHIEVLLTSRYTRAHYTITWIHLLELCKPACMPVLKLHLALTVVFPLILPLIAHLLSTAGRRLGHHSITLCIGTLSGPSG